MARTTAFYASLMAAFEYHRAKRGWSMAEIEERAQLSEGYYSKMLHAPNADGRRASIEVLSKLATALFDGACVVKLLEQHKSEIPAEANIKKINAAVRTYLRNHCIRIAPLGAAARNKKLTPAKRRALARRAIKARWKRHRERLKAERAAQARTKTHPKSRVGIRSVPRVLDRGGHAAATSI
jgi:transcriptional regulator with XRE-family HTH domain